MLNLEGIKMDKKDLVIGNWFDGTGDLEWSQTSPHARKFGIPGTDCTIAVNYITVKPGMGKERPMHKHEHEQIMLIMEGGGAVIVEGESYPMHDGSYVVIPPNVLHKYDASESLKNIINIDIFTPARNEFVHKKVK